MREVLWTVRFQPASTRVEPLHLQMSLEALPGVYGKPVPLEAGMPPAGVRHMSAPTPCVPSKTRPQPTPLVAGFFQDSRCAGCGALESTRLAKINVVPVVTADGVAVGKIELDGGHARDHRDADATALHGFLQDNKAAVVVRICGYDANERRAGLELREVVAG